MSLKTGMYGAASSGSPVNLYYVAEGHAQAIAHGAVFYGPNMRLKGGEKLWQNGMLLALPSIWGSVEHTGTLHCLHERRIIVDWECEQVVSLCRMGPVASKADWYVYQSRISPALGAVRGFSTRRYKSAKAAKKQYTEAVQSSMGSLFTELEETGALWSWDRVMRETRASYNQKVHSVARREAARAKREAAERVEKQGDRLTELRNNLDNLSAVEFAELMQLSRGSKSCTI